MRNVVITGGSSGIGAKTVAKFAEAGDKVWFSYATGEERAKKLATQLGKEMVFPCPLDLANVDSIKQFVKFLPKRVDVLVHNAGLGSATVEKWSDTEAEQDSLLMQVNAVGPLLLTKKLLPQLRVATLSKLIFISSVGGGIQAFPKFRHADGMSKAALAFLTRQLAAENVHTGLDVFSVCPGATETPMFNESTLSKFTDAEREAFIDLLPKRRLIKSEEIASLVFFLAGRDSTCLHGAVLDASMGLGVHPGLITGVS